MTGVPVVVDFPGGREPRLLRTDSGVAEGTVLSYDDYRTVRALESTRHQPALDSHWAPRMDGTDEAPERMLAIVLIVDVIIFLAVATIAALRMLGGAS
jgi:hypothetical protein